MSEFKQQELFWSSMFNAEDRPSAVPSFQMSDSTIDRDASSSPTCIYSSLRSDVSLRIMTMTNKSPMAVYMVLLVGIECLLYKYTGEEGIIVGVPTFEDETDEDLRLDQIMLIKQNIMASSTFKSIFNEFKHTLNEAILNQHVPFDKMAGPLSLNYDSNHLPMIPTIVSLDQIHPTHFRETVASDTLFQFDMRDDSIHVKVTYNEQAYDRQYMMQVIEHLNRIFSIMLFQPDLTIRKLNILSDSETNKFLAYNQTAAEYPREKMIHQLFEEQAERTPDQVAVVYEDSQLTYVELNERANRLARTLQSEGVQPDEPVGIMAERSLDMIVGLFGILKAGGAYVPIDPSFPEERIQYILEDSDTKLLLVQNHLRERVPFTGKVLELEDPHTFCNDGSNLEPAAGPNHLAYVIYTSGSTGKPKGVMVEHRSVINRLVWMQEKYPLDERDAILQKTAITFDVSVWELFWWSMAGSKLVLLPSGGEKNPELILDTIAQKGVSTMHFVPAMLHAFLESIEQKPSETLKRKLASLRHVFASGEALKPVHVAGFKRIITSVSQAQIINLYGPTEATIDVSYFECQADDKYASIPIGKPISNIQLYVLHAGLEHMQPTGVAGELCIAGDGLARGYLNRPELTAEKFADHPFAPGERMYRTGDLARWLPDGNIEYLGRIDHQVKIRGYRIEIGEVEAAFFRIPPIQEAIVIAQEINGETSLCAYYTANRALTAGELREQLSRQLPSYMIPAYFVQLKEMPLTFNGKIDRQALPSPRENLTGMNYEPPRTELEKILAGVWESVLGAEQVGISDHFFELGGDSIKSIQVSSRLYQAGYKFEIKHLFKYPTISELVPYVEPVTRIAEQGEIKGQALLTPIQHWFFAQEYPELHHYNQAVMLYWKEGLDESKLREVMKKITEHHDALRMVYVPTEHGYEARNRGIGEGDLFSLEVISLLEENNVAQAIETVSNEIQQSIHLTEGPLMKLGLFQCQEGDHLLIAIHHLVIDGVSWRILIEDIAAAYEQLQNGEAIRLPKKTDSYLLWAEQLKRYAGSPEFEMKNQYWFGHEHIRANVLPKDNEQVIGQAKDQETIIVQWTAEETERLLKNAHRAYSTEMNDLLLTGLGIAIHRWTGYEDILIHLEGHGRESIIPDLDISRTVGWFTSLYPVSLQIKADQDISQRIKTVKENLRKIPQKGIGYGLIKYLSDHPMVSELTGHPEISFNYLGQFDQDFRNGRLEVSPYSSGKLASDKRPITYTLDINGMISDGQLSLAISYCSKQYQRETMETCADLLKSSLQKVIEHCAAQDQIQLTPSDISLKEITIDELDQFVQQTQHLGDIENIYPLTPMQKGMLFHSLIDSASEAYFEQAAFDLKGVLDIEAFRMSLAHLAERYDILRTHFYTEWKDQPLQIVFRQKPIEIVVEDIRSMNVHQRSEFITAFARKDKARGFDLTRDALMRVSILRTEEDQARLIWSFHHILMDGWCLPLIMKEVFETYYAILEQRQPKRGAVTPYSRYIEWLDEQDHEQAAAYWKDYLDGYEGQTVLLKEQPSNQTKGYEKEEHVFRLGKQLTEEIKRTASRHQVTVNTWIQTAWGLLLQRYNGSQDVVFGTVVSGRPAEISGIESMVGLFINTIPVRIHGPSEMTVSQVLKLNQELALASQSYDTYPLYEIQAQTEQKQQLINHIMVFENYPVEKQMEHMKQGDTALDIINFHMEEHTHYDFTFIVMPAGEIEIRFVYNANVYDQASVERMQAHFMQIIKQMADDTATRVQELNILTADERSFLVDKFNDTAAEYPKEKTIHQLFEEQAERTPEQVAIVFEDEKLTYRQLNERANQLARTLRAKGMRADRLAAIVSEHNIELVVGILAVLKAGGAYVPIDPDYPEHRIQYILDDSKAEIILTQHHLQQRLAHAGTIVLLDEESSYHEEHSNMERISSAKDLAYVIYTSGSTGKPKGVLIEHQGLTNYIWWADRVYVKGEKTNFPLYSSIAFDLTVTSIFTPLISGNAIIVFGGEDRATLLSSVVQDSRVDIIKLTPAHLQLLNEMNIPHECTIRKMIVGGDNLSTRLARDISEQFQDQIEIFNEYGPTETVVGCMIYSYDPQKDRRESVPIGTAAANMNIYVLNADMKPVPIGVPGEMYISGTGIARGYLNRPDLTAEKFVEHPFTAGEKMYKTGDVARWLPDGHMEYLGRIDHQVKIRGYRIEIGEIEAALLQVESVKEAVVFALGEEGSKQLCAYLVGDKSLNTLQLKQQLLHKLPAYMIPAYFVRVEEMPLTDNGKIDRKALPAPDGNMPTGTEYVAPGTLIEKQLSEIWKDVLAHSDLGIKDNFFDVGGHSLKVLQLIHQINAVLGIKMHYHVVYDCPTIETMARVIQAEASEYKTDSVFVKMNQNGSIPVFCFPPLIGYGLVYNEMAKRLDGDCIVYAADFLEEPSYEKPMIDRYVESIIGIQEKGPYVLLGYSSGSNLAFEVAQAMEQRGCAVSDVIMLDSQITTSVTHLSEEEIEEIVHLNLDIIPDYYRELLTIPSIKDKIRGYLAYHNQLINSGAVNADIHHLLCDDLIERGWAQSTAHNYLEYELKGDHVTIFDLQYIEENVNTIRSIVKSIDERHHGELVLHEQLSLEPFVRNAKFDRR
ncbi:amino acid adenylation domain-containing protein [Bacillus atrophaeus]|uniref:non-ribosomal peptide synthetase n=1 Tax=Bacillus atrophaeus TaxID=1452 RepID=UPI002E1C521F|nr:non-ribosomal peptide synthetase [Bacillus atrophaeus]MED4786968.1 amino acid adenylation domain-containing protein [Bacillus atrophaeus]MED4819487.1 amino acid adenylation domain-containing protein [Bacillus atrophaeus]